MTEATVIFEGRPIEARVGESLAAALTAAGVLALRHEETGGERGMFCGMGVCQECLVTVDGVANRRACMTKVTGPVTVERGGGQKAAKSRAPLAPVTVEDVPVRRAELVVVGAGPAGLSAAIAARKAGADVLVLDERSAAGGQYFKQVSVSEGISPDAQHREGAALIAEARSLGVEIVNDATVWGAFEPLELAVTVGGGTLRVLPQKLILATGAYERGRQFPGWTLPGVMTTGAAQTLWRTARRIPGKRVLIAGNGPLNLQLAYELIEGGAEIVALSELGKGPNFASTMNVFSMAANAPKLVADGVRYQARLLAKRVPFLPLSELVSVTGDRDGLHARLKGADGSERQFIADAICLGYGFEPSSELLRVLGARHDFDAERGYLVPQRSATGETSVSGVYAVGDCTGIGGARIALAEGILIGLAASQSLGKSTDKLASVGAAARSALDRHRRFQTALWSMYQAPPQAVAGMSPETTVCRCESVTAGQLQDALGAGCASIGDLKRMTRAGMGRCQGRYCGALLNTAIAEAQGRVPHEYSGFAPRVPVKPLDIETLARRPAQ